MGLEPLVLFDPGGVWILRDFPSSHIDFHMGVSKNRGTPRWMVYKGNRIKMDDLEVPLF